MADHVSANDERERQSSMIEPHTLLEGSGTTRIKQEGDDEMLTLNSPSTSFGKSNYDYDEIRYAHWPAWEKEWDSAEGAYYYYNIWTHETTWIEPSNFEEMHRDYQKLLSSNVPDGIIMVKAAKRIQSMYRAKVAKREFNNQKRLIELELALDIYDERCDLWLEKGEIEYAKKRYDAAAKSLAKAVSNVHVDNRDYDQDISQETLDKKKRRRREHNSEFSSFTKKENGRSESSIALQRFRNRMKKMVTWILALTEKQGELRQQR